ncbi:MAG: MerR family transcriptional regulator [Alphaproteobacteria bacterium]|nr:MerR family transcriptional regulator [Alphaproteobacteria bacterium]
MDGEFFISINEVAKRLSIPAHTLRYWEKQFPTAIRPTTGAGGRRYYRTETIERLAVIKDLLYVRGMTIAGVKKLIHDGELPHSAGDFVVKTTTPQSRVQTPVQQPQQFQQNVIASTPQPVLRDISNDIETAISLLNTAREILTTV